MPLSCGAAEAETIAGARNFGGLTRFKAKRVGGGDETRMEHRGEEADVEIWSGGDGNSRGSLTSGSSTKLQRKEKRVVTTLSHEHFLQIRLE